MRDYLYKICFNLSEARVYLKILEDSDALGKGFSKTELLYRIHGMGLQCFALAMRRVTDRTGRRSLQSFMSKHFNDDAKEEQMLLVDNIYSHYKSFTDKGVAHQDDWSIVGILKHFPDSDVINEDLRMLNEIYYKVARELCSKFLHVHDEHYDFKKEMQRLL